MQLKLKTKVILFLILFFVLISGILYLPRAYRGKVIAKVVDKERITMQKDGKTIHKYLIYTEDEVFENVAEAFYFKFNSSDLYGRIQKNEKYEFYVSGWRIHIFSMYRNIISADRIVEETKK